MSNVVLFEPYRLRRRRQKVAAACRQAVAHGGVLVLQDTAGRILSLTGQFSFLDDRLEYSRDGFAFSLSYDEIKKVRVPSHERFNGQPNSG
jgi:hypothetical protein